MPVDGMKALINNELTNSVISELTAVASVVYQRNIVANAAIEQSFRAMSFQSS